MNEEDEEQRKPIMFKKQNQPTQNKHNHNKNSRKHQGQRKTITTISKIN